MAPRGRRATEVNEEPQAFHQLGVRGRKTGVAIPNTGEVDDQGFQPLEAIFSSPTKPSQSSPRDANNENEEEGDDDDDEDGGSEDMDISSSAGPGPRTLLKEQRTMQYLVPRNQSPIKSTLLSPARRSRLVAERYSSPLVDEREATVTRKIDFPSRQVGKARLGARTNGNGHGVNGTVPEDEDEEEQSEKEESEGEEEPADAGGEDDPIEMVGAQDETEDEQPVDDQGDVDETDEDEDKDEDDEPIVEQVQPIKRPRGRPSTSLVKESELKAGQDSAKKHKGRPPKSVTKPVAEEVTEENSQPVRGARKRRSRGSDNDAEDQRQGQEPVDEDEAPRQKKRQRTANETANAAPAKPGKPAKSVKNAKTASVPPAKPKGRPGRPKAKAAPQDTTDGEAGEASFLALQKGPPMPKRRGLVSVKRDPDVIVQTRAGRQSFRPLHWWAGDKVITEVEERQDIGRSALDFVTSSTKEVYRATPEQDERPRRGGGRGGGRGRGRGSKGKGRMANVKKEEAEEEEPPEDWELDRGIVEGEVMGWEPEYEHHPPADDDQVNVTEDLLAVSGDAVQTKDIKDATFRFAKTLTTPFMGAGIVDLPPGTEKRPKNSRKMHMVFFVHTGKVLVTVNETEFRISAGGQWFVPRGNYYSITNDYDRPARIFFSQANEVTAEAMDD